LPLKLYQLATDKEKMFLDVDEPAVPAREVQSGQRNGWFCGGGRVQDLMDQRDGVWLFDIG